MKRYFRDHKFENRLTIIEEGRIFVYLSHEKTVFPLKIFKNKAVKSLLANLNDDKAWDWLDSFSVGGDRPSFEEMSLYFGGEK